MRVRRASTPVASGEEMWHARLVHAFRVVGIVFWGHGVMLVEFQGHFILAPGPRLSDEVILVSRWSGSTSAVLLTGLPPEGLHGGLRVA